MKVNKKKVEDCLRELKVHGLVEVAGEESGEKNSIVSDGRKYVISDKAVIMVKEALRKMRERYPEASKEDVMMRALIFIVLNQMGLVFRESVPVYVTVLKALAEDYFDSSLV